jgi:hypothetical protein
MPHSHHGNAVQSVHSVPRVNAPFPSQILQVHARSQPGSMPHSRGAALMHHAVSVHSVPLRPGNIPPTLTAAGRRQPAPCTRGVNAPLPKNLEIFTSQHRVNATFPPELLLQPSEGGSPLERTPPESMPLSRTKFYKSNKNVHIPAPPSTSPRPSRPHSTRLPSSEPNFLQSRKGRISTRSVPSSASIIFSAPATCHSQLVPATVSSEVALAACPELTATVSSEVSLGRAKPCPERRDLLSTTQMTPQCRVD